MELTGMRILNYILTIWLMTISVVADADIILDQSNDTLAYYSSGQLATIGGPSGDTDTGQTFTVGATGILSSIELYGYNQNTLLPESREHTLSIFEFGAEYIPENALASISQTATSYSPQWFVFDFSDFNVSVVSGEEFMMLWTTEGDFKWAYNSYKYDAGMRYIRNTSYPNGTYVDHQDQIFRTYVSAVPVPPSLLLFGSGITLLAAFFSRRSRNSARLF